MADGEAWREDMSLEDALKHLNNDCQELARCFETGDEELAVLVATELAKAKAPVRFKLRQPAQDVTRHNSRTSSDDVMQAKPATPAAEAVAAAAAVLKAAGKPSVDGAVDVATAPKYPIGDRVEYFSQTAGGWIPAVVKGFDAERSTYVLDIQPIALPQKVRAVSNPQKNGSSPKNGSAEETTLQRQDTKSSNGGERTSLQRQDTKLSDAGESSPAGYPCDNGRSASTSSVAEYFALGSSVEYYSSTHSQWVPAVVQGFNEKTGVYKLDIQPVAVPSKIRRVSAKNIFEKAAAVGNGQAGPSPVNKATNPFIVGAANASSSSSSDANPFRCAVPSASSEGNKDAARSRHAATNPFRPARPCGLCQISHYVDELSGPQCDHLFCIPCLRSHVSGKDYMRVRIACPSCPVELTPVQIERIVGTDVYAEQRASMEREDAKMAQSLAGDVNEESNRGSLIDVLRDLVVDFTEDKESNRQGSRGKQPNDSAGSVLRPVEGDPSVARVKNPESSVNGSETDAWMAKQVQHGFQEASRLSRHGETEDKLQAGQVLRDPLADALEALAAHQSEEPAPSPAVGSRKQRPSCQLCNEAFEADLLLGPSCGHLFCQLCLNKYVLRHEFVRRAVKCPAAKCEAEMEPRQVRAVVGGATYDKCRAEVDEEAIKALQKQDAADAARDSIRHVFQCPLCLEEVARENCIELDCDHRFCASCFQDYLKSKISEAQVAQDELICPIPKCGKEITVAQIEGATANTPLWNKFLQFRMSIFVPAPGDGVLVECPTPNCEKFLVDKYMELVKCHSCNREFCPKCRKAAHRGSTCKAVAKMEKEAQSDDHFEELMMKEGWKPCPVCGAPSERESGCNFMQCRSGTCRKRTYWCYICGLQMKKEDHYTHFQKGPYEDQCKTPEHQRRIVARRRSGDTDSGALDSAWQWLSFAVGFREDND